MIDFTTYDLLDKGPLELLCQGIITRREYDCYTEYLMQEFDKACAASIASLEPSSNEELLAAFNEAAALSL
ncbi:hypothetical protein N9955_00625 [bacterium]|nr:hypothetical protein [bacterium]